MRYPLVRERLLDAVTTVSNGPTKTVEHTEKRTFQAFGRTTAGTGSVTVKVQGSNHPNPSIDQHWVDLMTITLSLSTTDASDGASTDAPWMNVRGKVTAISGTGANVDLWMGA